MIPIRPRYFFPPRSWRHALLVCKSSGLQIDLRDFDLPYQIVSCQERQPVSRRERQPLQHHDHAVPTDEIARKSRSDDAVRARMRPTASLATGPVRNWRS